MGTGIGMSKVIFYCTTPRKTTNKQDMSEIRQKPEPLLLQTRFCFVEKSDHLAYSENSLP